MVCGTGVDVRVRPAGGFGARTSTADHFIADRVPLHMLPAVELQLVNGTKTADGKAVSGRLMVKFNNQWGTVRRWSL